MASEFDKYFFRDGVDPLGAKKFNPILKSIDLRIDALEQLKVSWQEAVQEVSNIGLQRIDDALQPSVDSINSQITLADALIASAQAQLDAITALENNVATQDDIADFLVAADIANFITLSTVTGRQAIWIPASAMEATDTNGATWGTLETAGSKLKYRYWEFDPTIRQNVNFEYKTLKSWNAGAMQAKFVLSRPATTVNFGAVFGIQATAIKDGSVLNTNYGSAISVGDTLTNDERMCYSATTSFFTAGSSPAKEDYLHFQVFRNVDSSLDDCAVPVRLHGITLFIDTDAPTDA
jgi:hypothetical protein